VDISQNPKADPSTPSRPRDWTVPILIAVLGGLEIVILAVLFFFETPLTPYARRASATISGTIVLVGYILIVLCAGTAIFWAIYNKYKGRSDDSAV
jgi:hypothetical protein